MLIQLKEDLLRFIYPVTCEVCSGSLAETEEIICTHCRLALRPIISEGNINPVNAVFAGRVQVSCAFALYYYEKGEPLQALIHRLKYKSRPAIGITLGRWLGRVLKEEELVDKFDALIPMPITPSRKLVRGYNQAEKICEGIHDITGIPIQTEWLKRVAADGTQTKKAHFDRWEHVQQSFVLADEEAVQGKRVLLVDDIITTGATAEAALHVLTTKGGATAGVAAVGYTAW